MPSVLELCEAPMGFAESLLYKGFLKHPLICRKKDWNVYTCLFMCVQNPYSIGILQSPLFCKGLTKLLRALQNPFSIGISWNPRGFAKLLLFGALQSPLTVGASQSSEGICKAPSPWWLCGVLRGFLKPFLYKGFVKHPHICSKKKSKCVHACMYVCMKPLLCRGFAKHLLYRGFMKFLGALQNPSSIGNLWSTTISVGKKT